MNHLANRGRKIARSIGFVALQILIPVALVFIGGEIWVRFTLDADDTKNIWPSRFDPEIGYLFQSNSVVRWSNGLDFDVTQTSNASGFLDRPFPIAAKPAGTCRVAFVGDSFVEAAQVPIDKKVQFAFETQARGRWPGLPVETMATGYSGTGQINQLTFYDRFVSPRRPDVVVLVFTNNDFANNSALLEAVRNGWHPRHTPRLFARRQIDGGGVEIQSIDPDWGEHRLSASMTPAGLMHRLASKSRFYRWLYNKLSIMYPGIAEAISGTLRPGDVFAFRIGLLSEMNDNYATLLAEWGYPDAPDFDSIFYEERLPRVFRNAIELTGFALDQFMRRTSQQGARLVVLATYHVRGRYLERLRGLLAPRDIPLASQHEFLEAGGMAKSDVHFRHDGHWNETGHRLAAEQLVEFFAGEGLCGAH